MTGLYKSSDLEERLRQRREPWALRSLESTFNTTSKAHGISLETAGGRLEVATSNGPRSRSRLDP